MPTVPLISTDGFAMKFFRTLTGLSIIWGVCLVQAGWTADFFSTGFDGPSLDSRLQDDVETPYFEILEGSSLPGNVIHRAGTPGPLDRQYIMTVHDDYNSTDFVYELVFNNSGDGYSFVGLGAGTPYVSDKWPNHSVYWAVQENFIYFGYRDDAESYLHEVSSAEANADYRVRITKLADRLYFQLDEGNDGTFDYQPEIEIDLNESGPFGFLKGVGNSRLFFGTAFTQREFDDMSVARMGDLNDSNGTLDGNDVPAWIMALTDPAGYAEEYPNVSLLGRGDLDHNGRFDLADLRCFEQMLAGSTNAFAVPEPTGALLLTMGWTLLVLGSTRRPPRRSSPVR